MTLSHYCIGSGEKKLVFLHGLCEDKSLWLNTIVSLDAQYQAIALDLPGFGESPLLDQTQSIEQVAEQVVENLNLLSIDNPVLIGHSYGGYVGLAVARLFPDFLAGLGLINSSIFADSEEKKISRRKTIDFIARHGVKLYAENLFPDLFFVENRAKFAVKINELINRALSINPLYLQKTLEILASRPDSSHWLAQSDLPVLFVVGKQDGAVNFQTSLAQIGVPANSVVSILSDVGHMSLIEDEARTNQMIRFFADYCFSNHVRAKQ